MKLQLSDITSIFRSSYAEPKESFITADDVAIYWWMAMARFWDEVDSELTTSEASFPTFVDVLEYPLGSDVRRVKGVFNLQGSDWVRLAPVEYQQFIRMPYNEVASDFTHYTVYKNQLLLYPTPDSTSYESLVTGNVTNFAVLTNTFTLASPSIAIVTNTYLGQYIDITSADGSYTETFSISSHTDTALIVDHAPNAALQTGFPHTFEIWDYVDNIKVIYKERAPIPNEDEQRAMGSLTDTETAQTYEYEIPEEHLDILISYMLYKACVKDKLLADAQVHRNDWEIGLQKARRSAATVKDDFFAGKRLRGAFEYPSRLGDVDNTLKVFEHVMG